MNFSIFIIVATLSIFIAFLWQLFLHIYPAFKRVKIAESLAVLAKCVTKLNQKALLNAKICNGHYLHDKLYKLLFCVLTHKANLKFRMLSHVKYTQEFEEERKKFRSEIESLDEETKQIIDDAIFSVAKILILRDPLIFLLICLKVRQGVCGFHLRQPKQIIRRKMIISTEHLTITAKDDDYSFVPC